METKSNNILVGTVTLALLLAAAFFAIWLSRMGENDKKDYDIFFSQSVSGVAKGSGVLFSGVPVGEVKEIELWPKDPTFVRVRISIKGDVPVLQGTTATILSGFTGVSQVQLIGGPNKDAKPITALGPEGAPVIPTKPGALGELLNNAPLLLERLATLTERLTNLLDENNQESIAGILDNVEGITGNVQALTGEFKGQGAAMQQTLLEAQLAIAKAGNAADEIAALSRDTNQMLNANGQQIVGELSATLAQTNKTLKQAEVSLAAIQPAVNGVTNETLPQANALIRDLRTTTNNLNQITDKINDKGVGSLVGGSSELPDYKPKK